MCVCVCVSDGVSVQSECNSVLVCVCQICAVSTVCE